MMHFRRRVLLSFLPGAVYLYLFYLDYQKPFISPSLHFYVFVSCILLCALLFCWANPSVGMLRSLFFSVLTLTLFHRLGRFIPDISTTPWSLSWSEGSRYYYASLFFDRKLYGLDISSSILHTTRYLMQSVIFLIPNSPIWLHRLWQILLWLVTTFSTGWLLAYRLRLRTTWPGTFPFFAFIAWTFLYLMQGPVYYHLLVMVLLILWGVQPEHFTRSLMIVLVSSFWAGLSRLNWFPIPGLLAATIYLLECPISSRSYSLQEKRKVVPATLIKYLYYPALWILLGTTTAFISQKFYSLVSGNPIDQFNSALTSNLLWYRLYPNPTNPFGVLLQSVFVSIPMILIILYRSRLQRNRYHLFRKLGLAGVLCVLFVGGLVVSIKIGGGADLHNLDAYLVALWIIGSYYYFGALSSDLTDSHQAPIFEPLAWLALVIPLILSISFRDAPQHQDIRTDQAELQVLKQVLDQGKGEVLFINERQLLTFGEIKGVLLVPEYEAVFLMEMAMANNQDYLNNFHAELAVHRYKYIVSHILYIVHKARTEAFGEENDVWVNQVSEPILCYYEPILILSRVKIEVLAPRIQNCDAPVTLP
jgi:hypothetical protein